MIHVGYGLEFGLLGTLAEGERLSLVLLDIEYIP
jgi:hypothetical protein